MVRAMSSAPPPPGGPTNWSPPPPPRPQPAPLPQPVAATEPTEPTGPSADEAHARQHGRLALLLALSIAVLSVMGAVVGWRAEVHASSASRYEQDAVAAAIVATQLRSEAEAQASAAQSNYEHFRRLGDEADRLVADPCPVENPTTLIELDAEAACAMQAVFAGYDDPAYVKSGTFDVTKYAEDVQKVASYQADSDPETYESLAEQERHHEDNMLYLSLGLVLALALLTLARLGKSTASRLLLAVPGWLALGAGVVVLVVAEL
jgi:hypothetical protein